MQLTYDSFSTPISTLPFLHPIEAISYHGLSIKIKSLIINILQSQNIYVCVCVCVCVCSQKEVWSGSSINTLASDSLNDQS